MMNILLLYATTHGSTGKVSGALAQRFMQSGHTVTQADIRHLGEAGPAMFRGVDLIGIGSPVFHLRILPPMNAFLRSALRYVDPQSRVFIFITYGGISSGRAFLNVLDLLKRRGIGVVGALKVAAPHFFSDTPFPDEAALAAVDALCSGLIAGAFRVIPQHEAKRLFSYQKTAVRMAYPVARLVGRMRRIPISIDAHKCTACGRCVRECPVRALKLRQALVYHRKKCIHCYHCTAVCARHAVVCRVEKVRSMVRVNKKLLGYEQPVNGVFL